jgi:hypothetical protein
VVNGQPLQVAVTANFLQYGPRPAPAIPSPNQSVNLLSLAHGNQ